MTERTLTQAHLLRALLARQLLLERAELPIPAAIATVGGLQTQYAPSGYVGLWTRLRDFRRDDLTRSLEDRSVVQASLQRNTIHMVARDDYWPFTVAIRAARRAWALRVQPRGADEAAMLARAVQIEAALADGPKTVRELGPIAAGFVGNMAVWSDLVRVPPAGTWERRRADRLGLAVDWIGPPTIDEAGAVSHLVHAYLRAFGPASWKDIAAWAGLPVTAVRAAETQLTLDHHRDEAGHALVDLPGAPIPDPDTPIPVRFLPHWDANLLVHARRTGLLPEPHRPRMFSSKNPFSMGAVLVHGRVVAGWSVRDGRVELDRFESIDRGVADEVESERLALEAFHR